MLWLLRTTLFCNASVIGDEAIASAFAEESSSRDNLESQAAINTPSANDSTLLIREQELSNNPNGCLQDLAHQRSAR